MSTARSRIRRLHPDQCRRHVQLLEAARRYWLGLPDEKPDELPLPPRLDRRGLRLAWARTGSSARPRPTIRARPIPHRRPPPTTWCGPGSAPTACRLISQLLEQLRAVSVSREADPADDPQRARGQAAAGLRRRQQRARLALCRRPCARALRRCWSAAGSGESYNIGGRSERTNIEVVTDDLRRCWTSCRPTGRPHARLITLRRRPARPRPPLRDRRRARSRRELGWRAGRDFDTGIAQDRRVVPRQPRLVAAAATRRLPRASRTRPGTERTSSMREPLERARDGHGRSAGACRCAQLAAGTASRSCGRSAARRSIVDLAKPASLRSIDARSRPAIVVNAAAYTAVDQAESEPDARPCRQCRGRRRAGAACAGAGVPAGPHLDRLCVRRQQGRRPTSKTIRPRRQRLRTHQARRRDARRAQPAAGT